MAAVRPVHVPKWLVASNGMGQWVEGPRWGHRGCLNCMHIVENSPCGSRLEPYPSP